jgi:hypothetical protein
MPVNRFVDASLPDSELVRSLELAAKRFAANPAGDRADAAILRRQFETWAANDALFEPLVGDNKLLAEVAPLSKDLSALGEAGIKLLDYLTPAPEGAKKKLSKKEQRGAMEVEKAAGKAKADWLSQENAELKRLSDAPKRGVTLPADVRLAAYRPVKVLADAVGK